MKLGRLLLFSSLALTALQWLTPPSSEADEIYTFVIKKQEEKAKTRWSLAEWLETRDRMRLMDLWLALHSPSPYEFYVGGEYRMTEYGDPPHQNQLRAQVGAYASIFGLEFQKGYSPASEWLGLFHLRVFGFQSQGTNITLEAGLRSQDEPISARSALAGGSMAVYLTRNFGIEGLYRHYFPSVPNPFGVKASGNRIEMGAFIDFKYWRIYGNYFIESERREFGGSATDLGRNGATLGTRLFF